MGPEGKKKASNISYLLQVDYWTFAVFYYDKINFEHVLHTTIKRLLKNNLLRKHRFSIPKGG